jgi:hypothetical protein
VPFAKRPFHGPHAEYSVCLANVPHIVVAAKVNLDLVAIHFDQFGRLCHPGTVVLPR